jgi:hypothetical protein
MLLRGVFGVIIPRILAGTLADSATYRSFHRIPNRAKVKMTDPSGIIQGACKRKSPQNLSASRFAGSFL